MVITEGLFLNAVVFCAVLFVVGSLLILIASRVYVGRFPALRFSMRSLLIGVALFSILVGWIVYTDHVLRDSDRSLFQFIEQTDENMRRATPVIGSDGVLSSLDSQAEEAAHHPSP